MNERMYQEISNLLNYTEGDIIDFRVYKGTTFSYLVKLAIAHGRHAVGMDTFYGLEQPTLLDKNRDKHTPYPRGYAKSLPDLVHQGIRRVCGETDAYTLHEGKLTTTLENLPDRSYAFALIDLLHYEPTKAALEYVYDHMSPGGSFYFLNYNPSEDGLASKAINEFLKEKEDDIFEFPEIVYNENRLNVCRVAVKQNAATVADMQLKTESIKDVVRRTFKRETVNIALVLRTGGDTYNYKYVNALAHNIRNNTSSSFTLSVMTNDATGIDSELVDEIIPFKHNYPGWWSKIELFRPDIFRGQVFYMDLDTVVVRNIDDMLRYRPNFAGIRDLYKLTFLQTGVMCWNPYLNTHIYDNFVPRSHRIIHDYSEGDARWIRENVHNYRYLSDDFPDKIVSYKAHCLGKDGKTVTIPPKASIVCFHGRPRPHTITNPVVTDHWNYNLT